MRILIADDHGIVREGLRSLLAKEADMEVVGEAADGEAALQLAAELRPDVAIVDITMPRVNGIEVIRQLRDRAPSAKVIALSMHAEGHIVRAALEAGALAYVLKTNLFDELRNALHAVGQGARYLSPRVTDLVVHDWLTGQQGPDAASPLELTSRERQIVQLTAEGKSVKEIAYHLGVSDKTIHANRRKLMEKLGLSTVAELTRYAIGAGLTSLDH